jgi:glycerol kinase
LAWLLSHHGWGERARRGEICLGTVDTWLVWQLTGGSVYATDPTNASRTMLFDIETRAWSPEMGELLHVPVAAMAAVRPSSGSFGVADPKFFGAPIPISGVCGEAAPRPARGR